MSPLNMPMVLPGTPCRCGCGGMDEYGNPQHIHGPITLEHAEWCRHLRNIVIGPKRTLLDEECYPCAKAFLSVKKYRHNET